MTLTKLYKLHGGICWICGLAAPFPGKVHRRHKLSASRDHVLIPIGEVKILLAHRVCNEYRGYRGINPTKTLITILQRVVEDSSRILNRSRRRVKKCT